MFGQNKPFGSGFGSTFGSPSTSTFGQPATAGFGTTPAFGTSSVFGSPSTSTSGNVFGGGFGTTTTTASASSGLFGGTTSFGSPGFGGASTAPSMFGSPAAQPKPFGSSFTSGTSGGGLFGASSTQQAGGLFGQQKPAGTSLFGSSTGFGTQQQGQGSYAKFSPANTGVDTMIKGGVSSQVNTRHQTITMMKEYENKSIEEIRAEDYVLGRNKRPAGGAFGSSFNTPANNPQSLFGASTTSAGGGMFGQSNAIFGAPATTTASSGGLFGQTSGGLFGQTKPAFGSPPTSTAFGFGQSQPQQASITGGLFGQSKPAFGSTSSGGLFGSTTAQPGAFGATAAPGFSFGAATSQPSAGLFGAKTTGFGATATTSTPGFGGFGQTTSQPSLFGSAAGGGLFGKPTTSVAPFGTATTSTPSFGGFGSSTGAFGATAQPSGGLFGAAKPTFGGFGAAAQPATSAPAFGTGNAFGGFGSSTGAFGASKPGGMFGTSTTTSTGGFGSFGTGSTFGTGTAFGAGTGGMFGSAQPQQAFGASMMTQQPQQPAQPPVQLIGSPYGDSPLFRNLGKRAEKKDELKPTSLIAQRAYAKPPSLKFKPSIEGGAKPLTRRSLVASSPQQTRLFEGLPPETDPLAADVPMPSAKKSIKAFRLPLDRKKRHSDVTPFVNGRSPPYREGGRVEMEPYSAIADSTPIRRDVEDYRLRRDDPPLQPDQQFERFNGREERRLDEEQQQQQQQEQQQEQQHQQLQQEQEQGGKSQEVDEQSDEPPVPSYPAGMKCTRSGYFTIPSAEELEQRVDADGRCFVDGFTVGRVGYGSVYFPDTLDVSGLDIDSIVHIRRKEIVVYPDDSTKPPLDQGLNRRAEVTLDGCWPASKAGDVINTPERLQSLGYAEMLEKNCRKMGATFKDYRYETGSWVFSVRHFSKYGLNEGEEEECFAVENATQPKPAGVPLPMPMPMPLGMTRGPHPAQKPVVPFGTFAGNQYPSHENQYPQNEASRMEEERTDSESMAEGDDDMTDHGEEEQVPILSSRLEKSLNDSNFMVPRLFTDYGQESLDFDEEYFTGGAQERYAAQPLSPLGSDSLIPTKKEADHSFLLRQNLDGAGEETVEYDPFEEMGSAKPVMQDMGLPRVNLKPRLKFAGKVHVTHFEYAGVPDPRGIPICWNSRNVIVHTGKSERKLVLFPGLPVLSGEAPEQRHRSVICETVGSTMYDLPSKPEFLLELHESSLWIILENSVFEREDDPCPHIISQHGEDLVEKLAANHKQLLEKSSAEDIVRFRLRDAKRVGDLIEALLGDLKRATDIGTQRSMKTDISEHESVVQRRKRLSQWLEEQPYTLAVSEDQRSDKYFPLFEAIVAHKMSEAAALSKAMSEPYLVQVLNAGSDDSFADFLKSQLDTWRKRGEDESIPEMLLRVYCLMARLSVWSTSDGRVIHPLAGLDWRRSFALILWYYTPSVSDVSEAIELFEQRLQESEEGEAIITYPSPPYARKSHGPKDMAYNILQFYRNRTKKEKGLELLVASETVTNDALDFRMKRHNGVERLLHRNVFLEGTDAGEDSEWRKKEEFFTEKLRLKRTMLARAKAYVAGYHSRHEEEAMFLIEAEAWLDALSVVVNVLTPECFGNNEYEKLELLLTKMNRPEILKQLSGWDETGGLFLDFIHLMKRYTGKMKDRPIVFDDFRKLVVVMEGRRWPNESDRLTMRHMCEKLCRCVEDLTENKGEKRSDTDILMTVLTSQAASGSNGSLERGLRHFVAGLYDLLEAGLPNEWYQPDDQQRSEPSNNVDEEEQDEEDESSGECMSASDAEGDYSESFGARQDDDSETSSSV